MCTQKNDTPGSITVQVESPEPSEPTAAVGKSMSWSTELEEATSAFAGETSERSSFGSMDQIGMAGMGASVAFARFEHHLPPPPRAVFCFPAALAASASSASSRVGRVGSLRLNRAAIRFTRS